MTDEFDVTVGTNLRKHRLAAGMSQAAVGEVMGAPQQTVLKIERGERPLRLSEAAKLAQRFGIEVTRLMEPAATADVQLAAALNEVKMASTAMMVAAAELASALMLLALALGAHRNECTPSQVTFADELLGIDWGQELTNHMVTGINEAVANQGLELSETKPASVPDALKQLADWGTL